MTQSATFRILNNFLKDNGCRNIFWSEVAKYGIRNRISYQTRRHTIKYSVCPDDKIIQAFNWMSTSNGVYFWRKIDRLWRDYLCKLNT